MLQWPVFFNSTISYTELNAKNRILSNKMKEYKIIKNNARNKHITITRIICYSSYFGLTKTNYRPTLSLPQPQTQY